MIVMAGGRRWGHGRAQLPTKLTLHRSCIYQELHPKAVSQSAHRFWIWKFNAGCNYQILPIDGDVPVVWGPLKSNWRMCSLWSMVIVTTFNALFSVIDQKEESTKLAELMSARDDHCPITVPLNDQSEPVSMGCWVQDSELCLPGC